MKASTAVLSCSLACGAAAALGNGTFGPLSWGITSICIWLVFALSKGWTKLSRSDKYHLAWGWSSTAAFITFLRIYDPTFQAIALTGLVSRIASRTALVQAVVRGFTTPKMQGWSDVYYFCGKQGWYCSCDLRWNLAGWLKATVLWNFVLTSALAVQKLVIQAGLQGLLPGEELVTKESFISICWRLIPYWLNNWEQQWGAECSSMMFELPHFAVELLVVLPLVQILSARLRILALPAGRALRPNIMHLPAAVREDPEQMAILAPDVIRGLWRPMANQQRFFSRARANLRMLLLTLGVISLACFNAMRVPLALEGEIYKDPRSAPLMASQACGSLPDCWAVTLLDNSSHEVWTTHSLQCSDAGPLSRAFQKHSVELTKMQSAAHKDLIPLVETALAIMRLSCERFFVLVSVFAAYLMFHSRIPRWLRSLIRVNHRLSKLFQQVILNSFPAVCWIYGAGVIFSSFVSLVFWGATARRLYDYVRKMASIVRPLGLQDATAEQIERMNGNCAICWSEMDESGIEVTQESGNKDVQHQSKALPCGHAFHEACIQRWLKQCHEQARQATCPLCNRLIKLQISFRLPFSGQMPPDILDEPVDVGNLGDLGLGVDAGRDLQDFFQRRRDGLREAMPAPPAANEVEAVRPITRRRRVAPRLASSSLEQLSLEEREVQQPGARPEALTTRSAPMWREGPQLPVRLTQGADRQPPVLRARPRAARSSLDSETEQACETSFRVADEAPSSFNYRPSRPPSSTLVASGNSEKWAAWAEGEREEPGPSHGHSGGESPRLRQLAAMVQRDRKRATAYLEHCQAQDAHLQAKIEHCAGVMSEAWQTATELFQNAEQLERMLAESQQSERLSSIAGISGQSRDQAQGSCGGPEDNLQGASFDDLWQRQQILWEKSQELHKEGSHFMKP